MHITANNLLRSSGSKIWGDQTLKVMMVMGMCGLVVWLTLLTLIVFLSLVTRSFGGNIAHHLAVRLGPGSPELAQIKVRGYVMMAPFFVGKERTRSEAEGLPETFLNVDILDMFWRMSLPIRNTADHPYANLFGPQSPNLEPIKLDPILLIAGGDEIMKDRVELYICKDVKRARKDGTIC
ncbi:hypothetical protein OSB04_009596 [Centaurea solstitialis]|uniref:Alpha/beta hydrolase fold-3 domain-containing protein n=1 Tax=Centaurea solstitialis TaxID=347529 RepID=A0AA38TNZ3_9ASTR|nr:hypothetical protein OSB04_009596 [Centaurea solstitialis]